MNEAEMCYRSNAYFENLQIKKVGVSTLEGSAPTFSFFRGEIW